MKSVRYFFKILMGVLAVLFGCYLFTEIIDKIKNGEEESDDDNDEPKFLDQVIKAAKVQINKIK